MDGEPKYSKKISVIIMAYNRDTYLEDAIRSVINQTLDRKFFEVIVIKNFRSERIDKVIEKENFCNIMVEKPTLAPEMLSIGVEHASNEIITFLEDDDLFYPDKLLRTISFFNDSKKEVVFHHNEAKIFYESPTTERSVKFREKPKLGEVKFLTGPKFDYEVVFYDIGFNLSSMSLLKSEIRLNHFKTLLTNQDMFILFCALISGKTLVLDNAILTKSRVHSGNVSVNLSPERANNFNLKYAYTFYQISEMIKFEEPIVRILKLYMVGPLIEYHIHRKEINKIITHDIPSIIKIKLPYILAYDPTLLIGAFKNLSGMIVRKCFPGLANWLFFRVYSKRH